VRDERQRTLRSAKIRPRDKRRPQRADGLLRTAQAEQQYAEVVPGAGERRSVAARRWQALRRGLQTGVGSSRRLLAGEITGRRRKKPQGLRAAPGAVIDQAEELQRHAVVRDRPQDAARDPLRLRQIAALIERSQ
jgi:hypothetical protein